MSIAQISKSEIQAFLKSRDLRILVLECPYDTIEDPYTKKILSEIMGMKISGYKKVYPYGALPVDSFDLSGNHIVLCERFGNEYLPACGMKSITYSQAKIFQTEFPAFGILPKDSYSHHESVKQIIHEASAKNEQVAYNGSYTVHPRYSEDRAARRFFRELGIFFLTKYYMSYNIHHVIAGAALQFKIDEVKRFVGFKPISYENAELPPIDCPTFFGASVLVMHLQSPRQEAIEWANLFEPLWENRITIESPQFRSTYNEQKAA